MPAKIDKSADQKVLIPLRRVFAGISLYPQYVSTGAEFIQSVNIPISAKKMLVNIQINKSICFCNLCYQCNKLQN